MKIYLVIAWHLIVSASLLAASFIRHSSPDWAMMQDVALKYDFAFGALAIPLIVSCFGLFFRKAWGYHTALSVNAGLFILPLGMFAISALVFYPDFSVFLLFKSSLTALMVGLISFFVFIWLLNPKVKRQYVPSNI